MRAFDVLERYGYATTYEVVTNGIAWSKRSGYDILGDKGLLQSDVKGIMFCEGNYIMMEVDYDD